MDFEFFHYPILYFDVHTRYTVEHTALKPGTNHTLYNIDHIKEMRREKRFCNHGIDAKDDFGLEVLYVPALLYTENAHYVRLE